MSTCVIFRIRSPVLLPRSFIDINRQVRYLFFHAPCNATFNSRTHNKTTKMKYSLACAAIAATLASAAPTKTISKRADFCGQYDSTVTGSYTVYNNLWGQDNADSGSGCTGVDSLSGNTVAWHST